MLYGNNNLSKECNFDTFVVGDSNSFSHTLAVNITEDLSRIVNVAFLYGKNEHYKTYWLSYKELIILMINLRKIISQI